MLFGGELGREFEGTQWGRGAISTAEWTGVRLCDILEAAEITTAAIEVMPESLDTIRARRPLPLAKALARDTIVAFAMNGEPLPAEHGFPARLVVSGWLGAASIKWLGRIEVSEHAIQVPWNTEDYVLINDENAAMDPGGRSVITEPALSTLVELPWPATLHPGPQLIRGRAFAGERRIAKVEWSINDEPWAPATILSPGEPGYGRGGRSAGLQHPVTTYCGFGPPTTGGTCSRSPPRPTPWGTCTSRSSHIPFMSPNQQVTMQYRRCEMPRTARATSA